MIVRRNDRYRDIDNGTRATITGIDQLTGALTVQPDDGGQRVLDAAYVSEHVEHAYALSRPRSPRRQRRWAAVIGRASEFTAEWAAPPSRPRTQTQLHVIAEPTAARREREQYAPPEPAPTLGQA